MKVTAKQAPPPNQAPRPTIRITPNPNAVPVSPQTAPTPPEAGEIRRPVIRYIGPGGSAPAVELYNPAMPMPILEADTKMEGIDLNNDERWDKVSALLDKLDTPYRISRNGSESQTDAESRAQAAITTQYPDDQYPNLEIVSVFSGNTIIAFIPLNVPLKLVDGREIILGWDNDQAKFTVSASSPPPARP